MKACNNILRIPYGNDFRLHICYKNVVPSEDDDSSFADISDLLVVLRRFPDISISVDYELTDEGDALITLPSGMLAKSLYSLEITGMYDGHPWRWKALPLFRIVDANACGNVEGMETFGEETYFVDDTLEEQMHEAGTGIMGAVNMGTGTPREAGELLEYCNFPGGTAWSDLRKKNGHAEPYGIKTWCIGNEMDGPWQICHLDAVDYGKKACETAKIMKWIDDSLELVACGSASSALPTFPEWDRIVLEQTYEHIDYLSLHRYYENLGNDDDFLASFVDMNSFIHTVTATADYVKALKRSKKTVNLSFDEWNVWYQQKQQPHGWEACLAQLVNVIAPIFTMKGGSVIRQTIFWPFKHLSVLGRGTVLKPVVKAATKETCYGETPVLATAVVHSEEKQEVTVFCLNIDKNQSQELKLELRDFPQMKMIEHIVLTGNDLNAVNSFEKPDNVTPRSLPVVNGENGAFSVNIEKLSWNVLRFKY